MGTSDQNLGADLRIMENRRETTRFPLREEVRYTVQSSKTAKMSGVGRTLDFASGGILFTTEELLPVGRRVELSVSWPARLGGTCPLQFVATGRVVRAESNRAAVRIERYEFKTRGLTASPRTASALGA